jgi:O-methyltransferase involved in polyketide biosynthesis
VSLVTSGPPVPTSQPAVIVADGLLPFRSQDDFASVLTRLISHFPGGELALNLYTRYAIWTLWHSPGMAVIAGDVVNPNFNDPHQDPHRPERWADGLKLIEDFPDRAPEVSELPLMMQATSRQHVAKVCPG